MFLPNFPSLRSTPLGFSSQSTWFRRLSTLQGEVHSAKLSAYKSLSSPVAKFCHRPLPFYPPANNTCVMPFPLPLPRFLSYPPFSHVPDPSLPHLVSLVLCRSFTCSRLVVSLLLMVVVAPVVCSFFNSSLPVLLVGPSTHPPPQQPPNHTPPPPPPPPPPHRLG